MAAVLLLATGLLVLATGCQTTSEKDYDPIIARFFLEANPQEGYAAPMVLPISKVMVPVNPKPVISEIDIIGVDMVQVDLGRCLSFRVTRDAARDLYRLSVDNLGRRLVLTLNGEPVGVRRMDRPLSYGNIMIFLEISDEQLEKTASDLELSTIDVQKAVAASS